MPDGCDFTAGKGAGLQRAGFEKFQNFSKLPKLLNSALGFAGIPSLSGSLNSTFSPGLKLLEQVKGWFGGKKKQQNIWQCPALRTGA